MRMCSGKTHLLCSAAVVSTPIIVSGAHQASRPIDTSKAVLSAGLVLVGAIAGLFPDLDAPESELLSAPGKLGRGTGWVLVKALGLRQSSLRVRLLQEFFRILGALVSGLIYSLSLAIRSFTRHRGFTHQLGGMLFFSGFVALATYLFAGMWDLPSAGALETTLLVGWAWALGYLTHLFLDAATISGIPLLSSRQQFHLLPRGRRIRTGTWPDTVLLRGLAIGWFVLLLVWTAAAA